MAKIEIKVSEREQEWSKDNEPLQSGQSVAAVQSEVTDTPGYGPTPVQSQGPDTPGFGRGGAISPLAD